MFRHKNSFIPVLNKASGLRSFRLQVFNKDKLADSLPIVMMAISFFLAMNYFTNNIGGDGPDHAI